MNTSVAYESVKQTILILTPEVLILLAATAMITASPFLKLSRRMWCGISAGVLAAATLALLLHRGMQTDLYSAVALNDAFSFYSRLMFLVTGFIILGLAVDEPTDERAAEFFGALLMINAGAMLVAAANEIIFLFVGLELVSIPTYLLLYLTRRTARTQEAATKYFFLSIFASGLLLYGLTFLYGITGLTNLKAIAFLIVNAIGIPQSNLALIAILFVIAGLSFRVASVPFHFYAPDVYEGSPTLMAALLSWIPKAIGFLAMVRVLTVIFAPLTVENPLVNKAVLVAWVIAAATMTLGNTVALLQNNLKRLLAYSSIAHAGYLMIGIAVGFTNGEEVLAPYLATEGVLFYLVAYGFMTLGTFGIIMALRTEDGRQVETVDDLAGLGWTQPLVALGMSICVLGLSGFPFLAGFWGKLQLFTSAFSANPDGDSNAFVLLAILAVLNSAVGAYYYLRIVVTMYLRQSKQTLAVRGGLPMALSIGACVSLTVLIGLIPAPVSHATRAAAIAARALPNPASSTTLKTDASAPVEAPVVLNR